MLLKDEFSRAPYAGWAMVSPLRRAKAAFEEVNGGTLRGRDSFRKLLEAQSDLRLAGFDPARDEAYRALETTRDEFTALLHSHYRRAARDNYEDSTDEHFSGSGRTHLEAISDLHLVPAYMDLGGLDPDSDASWKEIGVMREDFLKLQRTHLVAEAVRSYDLAHNEAGRTPQNRVFALEGALYYLGQAGFDPADEEAYRQISTTKTEFEAFMAQQKKDISPFAFRP